MIPLPSLFDNAEWMGIENIGYDFLINNKCKLDVKGSCICDGSWHYIIKKNKIANYFLLFAFDNRIDLNILHIWLVKVNNLSTWKEIW